ncbi:MAG: nitrous oxide reductase family maturation protein NosD [Saprospiraceae bacterium]|nr:nitrous oxide reductase family maturation protein NosD [Saprospiraceae bacterium]
MKNSIIVLYLFLPFFAFGKTIKVVAGNSIRQAIATAQAYDTIEVKNGYFYENQLVINIPLSIIGENFPIIDAQYQNEIFTIKAHDVTIKGFHLMNIGKTATIDWAAVKILETRNVRVEGNHIENAYFGIYLSASHNCWVENNFVTGKPSEEQNTGNGIHAWKCDSLLIKNNFVKGHRDGIYFEFVTQSSIERNFSTGNIRYGLHFMFSHNDTYTDNTIRDNGAGVAVMYTRHVTMLRNHFDHNWGSAAYGLLLKDISDSQIENNTFNNNTVGIFMEGSSRIVIQNNQFHENGWAVRVQASCDNNVFSGNNFTSNTFDIATNGSTMLNKFEKNYWDKYEGYDLNRDGIGDIGYHPVSLFASIIEQMPHGMMLLHSFMVNLMERAEKIFPSLTPEDLIDNQPVMKPISQKDTPQYVN